MKTTNDTKKSKHRNKRNRTERQADLALCESLALRGHTHAQISAAISAQRNYTVSRQLITYSLKRLRAMWLESTLQSFSDARAMELKRLDVIEGEAWAEFEKSKLSESGSNPAWTTQILGIHDRRAKLLGLASPARCEISGPAGAPVRIEATALPSGPIDESQKLEILRRHVARMEAEAVTVSVTETVPVTPAN